MSETRQSLLLRAQTGEEAAWKEMTDRNRPLIIGWLIEPATLRAFRRLAFDGASGAEVAEELGLSAAAVCVGKSRVRHGIREEAGGLID